MQLCSAEGQTNCCSGSAHFSGDYFTSCEDCCGGCGLAVSCDGQDTFYTCMQDKQDGVYEIEGKCYQITGGQNFQIALIQAVLMQLSLRQVALI